MIPNGAYDLYAPFPTRSIYFKRRKYYKTVIFIDFECSAFAFVHQRHYTVRNGRGCV